MRLYASDIFCKAAALSCAALYALRSRVRDAPDPVSGFPCGSFFNAPQIVSVGVLREPVANAADRLSFPTDGVSCERRANAGCDNLREQIVSLPRATWWACLTVPARWL